MLEVTGIFIYPIKSLRGIALDSSEVTKRGFLYDRQWMLVDENNKFLSQREFAKMALLQPSITTDSLLIHDTASDLPPLKLSLQVPPGEELMVNVWGDRCRSVAVGHEADEWFTLALGMPCRLVYMPEKTNRWVDGRYAHNKETTTFSDGYPFMMLGEASLSELNSRLVEPVLMNRFRPNIVFSGGEPFAEDTMKEFAISGIDFFGVKLCARCVMTTIDQETGISGKEPLRTLAGYRLKNKKVYFGQNLLHRGEGAVKVGDTIVVK